MFEITGNPNAVLASAIANEEEARKILLEARETVSSPLSRATFEFLANEELNHIELIKDFAKSLDGVDEWDPSKMKDTSLASMGEAIRGIFQRFSVQFEEVGTADDERLEIYQVAMDMERRGYVFYTKAAEHAENEEVAELFRFLAEEEQRHFDVIQDTHDFLKQPDALLAMEERWMQT